jgi:hypothetical protein
MDGARARVLQRAAGSVYCRPHDTPDPEGSAMPSKRANVKNEKEYEALKDKGCRSNVRKGHHRKK